MVADESIAITLATQLTLLGLKKGDCKLNGDQSGERFYIVARWKICNGSNVSVYCYFGNFFGADRVWVGFGARHADSIRSLVTGIRNAAYTTIRPSDLSDHYDLIDCEHRAELRRNNYTAFEDHTDSLRPMAWFGQYFAKRSDVVVRALPLLRLVIGMQRARHPSQSEAHLGAADVLREGKDRKGQDKFREAVLGAWGWKCAVTKSEIAPALEAAHIRKWSCAKSKEFRTSPDNGLPMLRSLHALFDLGLISFSDDGQMLISRYLDLEERLRLNIKEGMTLHKPLSPAQKENMAFHRENSYISY